MVLAPSKANEYLKELGVEFAQNENDEVNDVDAAIENHMNVAENASARASLKQVLGL